MYAAQGFSIFKLKFVTFAPPSLQVAPTHGSEQQKHHLPQANKFVNQGWSLTPA
jgi:hypothetical protein